tara:strand:+ start:189 stop:500 length:312 start_codon:yes stop_codon:yes gene_type:complete
MINQICKERKRQQLEVEGRLVSNIDEQRVNGLTVKIDRDLCVGFGDCIDLAETVFEFDEENIAVIKEEIDIKTFDEEGFLEACRACPVDAITVLDGNGEQVAP